MMYAIQRVVGRISVDDQVLYVRIILLLDAVNCAPDESACIVGHGGHSYFQRLTCHSRTVCSSTTAAYIYSWFKMFRK